VECKNPVENLANVILKFLRLSEAAMEAWSCKKSFRER
jgi:hypothetical protein